MRSWRAVVAAFGAAAVLVVGAGSAGADPTNAKNGEILTIECDGDLGTLTIATNGIGEWTPGIVTTNNQVGIPYRFLFEGSFTPTDGDPVFFTDEVAKPAPRSGRLAMCTFHEEGEEDGGVFELDGTVWISYTPAH